MAVELEIDPELERCLTPLTHEEIDRLEQNCIKAGKVRDSIKVWDGKIIDGFHRSKIARKHGLPFTVDDSLKFNDKKEALLWIRMNQLGRRNLTDSQRTIQRALVISEMEGETRKAISEKLNVTRRTVRRSIEHSEAIKSLPDDIRDRVETYNLIATSKDLSRLHKLPESEKNRIYAKLREDPSITLHQAMPEKEANTKVSSLPVEDQEELKGTLPNHVVMRIASGSIASDRSDIAKIKSLNPERQVAVGAVLANKDATTLREAINIVTSSNKPKPAKPKRDKLEEARVAIRQVQATVDEAFIEIGKNGSAEHTRCIECLKEVSRCLAKIR